MEAGGTRALRACGQGCARVGCGLHVRSFSLHVWDAVWMRTGCTGL